MSKGRRESEPLRLANRRALRPKKAARLRGKPTETLRAILDVKAEFGDAVLEQ